MPASEPDPFSDPAFCQTVLPHAQRLAELGLWDYRPREDRLYWSEQTLEIFGVSRAQFRGRARDFLDRIHPEDQADHQERVDRADRSGQPHLSRYRIRTLTGEIRWLEERGEVEYDTEGVAVRRFGVVRDVTSARQSMLREEEAALHLRSALRRLQRSEERFRTVFLQAATGIGVTDLAGRFTAANPAFHRLVGYSEVELTLKSLGELFPERSEEQGSLLGLSLEPQAEPLNELLLMRSAHGPDRWTRLSLSIQRDDNGDPIGTIVLLEDVDQQQRILLELEESEKRFQLIARATNDPLWDWDLQTSKLWWNSAHLAVFGYDPSAVEPTFEAWHSRLHPEDRARVVASIEQARSSGQATWTTEYRYRAADGTYRHVLDRGYLVRDRDERPTRMVGAMLDITERRQTELLLGRQATLLDQASDAIIVRDPDNRVLYLNRRAQELYGWSLEEASDRPIEELIYEETSRLKEATQQLLRTGEWTGELKHLTRCGKRVTVLSRWTLLRDPEGQPDCFLAINTDITQTKKLEQQLQHAQRLESLGTLASGIAHDLNNILAPILMALDLLREHVEQPEAGRLLETLTECSQRGVLLLRQILNLAQRQEPQIQAVSAPKIVEEVHRVLSESFPKNIELILEPEGSLWPVLADPTQLHQVLMNLCLNARDALPTGGRVRLTLENREVDEVLSELSSQLAPGPYVLVSVEDNGRGIPEEVKERIFEPFFSTKGPGKGTGLGLSICYSIVTSYGGTIEVYSSPGEGTQIRVYLPAAPGATEALSPVSSSAEPPQGSGQTILVVDDEAAVREVAAKVLGKYGYQVLTAKNGAEAITVYLAHQHSIALVVTDMSMPIMDGPALAVALRSLKASVPILGASGLGAGALSTRALEAGVDRFLTKPFTVEALLGAVRDLLESS